MKQLNILVKYRNVPYRTDIQNDACSPRHPRFRWVYKKIHGRRVRYRFRIKCTNDAADNNVDTDGENISPGYDSICFYKICYKYLYHSYH